MAVREGKRKKIPKQMENPLEVTEGVVHVANSLISVAIFDATVLSEVQLEASLFPLRWQQDVWIAMETMYEAREQIDLILLCEHLDKNKIEPPGNSWLAEIGGMLQGTVGVRSNAKSYAEHLQKWQRRARCADVGRTLFMTALDGEDGSDEAIRELMAMNSQTKVLDGPLSESVGEAMDDLDRRASSDGTVIPGLSYGITALDNNTGGMGDEHLIILAARPSMGKTALALNIAWANTQQSVPVGFISTEQPRREMINRLVSISSEVDAQAMRLGKLDDEQWVRVTHGYSAIGNAPLYMNDKPAPHINDVIRQARKWKHRYGIKLLIVDYIQRVRSTLERRHEAVGEVARELKNLARELKIPVLALSQINRDIDKRENKTPTLADLRESGDLEQEADVVLFLVRMEVYDSDPRYVGRAQIINDKNRHGPIGKVDCAFVGKYLKFEDFRLDGGTFDEQPPDDLYEREADRVAGRGRTPKRAVVAGFGPDRRFASDG